MALTVPEIALWVITVYYVMKFVNAVLQNVIKLLDA